MAQLMTLDEFRKEIHKTESSPKEKPEQPTPLKQETWTIEQYRNYLETGNPNGVRVKKKTSSPEEKDNEDKPKKNSKYRNKKVEYEGRIFDSQKEANYYKALQVLKRIGEVIKIELQVPYLLYEGYINAAGKKIRPITYIADFRVTYADGRVEVVDTKGFKTETFRIKKKLLEGRYKDLILKVI